MKTILLLLILATLPAFEGIAGSVQAVTFRDADGKQASMNAYQGKVVLVVNVASRCGYTPQYRALETLYRQYKDKGLVVLGFPCGQFGGQEPSTAKEVQEFAATKYGVTFPICEKLLVNGPGRHGLYAALAGAESPCGGSLHWNFTKFLVGKDGSVLKRFEPYVTPDSKEIMDAITSALDAK
jgi:glutathione peroxidase